MGCDTSNYMRPVNLGQKLHISRLQPQRWEGQLITTTTTMDRVVLQQPPVQFRQFSSVATIQSNPFNSHHTSRTHLGHVNRLWSHLQGDVNQRTEKVHQVVHSSLTQQHKPLHLSIREKKLHTSSSGSLSLPVLTESNKPMLTTTTTTAHTNHPT